MILKYGTYSHSDNECTVVIDVNATYNELGNVSGYVEQWSIQAIVQAATAAAVTTAYEAMRTAYSTNGLDMVLYDSDGSTIRHVMSNNGSRKGLQITQFGYPQGQGAEGSTFRTVSITARTEYERDLGLYSRSERYEFNGGGSQFALIPTLIGPPIKQQIRQQTPYRCIQSGSAIGLGAYPSFPPPAFPDDEHTEMRVTAKDSPREIGPRGNRMYPISWQYFFESASPMFGSPG